MTTVQIIPGTFQITDPTWPRYRPWVSGRVYTADDFTNPGVLSGSHTDAALGGFPALWEGRAQGWVKAGGQATWQTSGESIIEAKGNDYEIEFVVDALPTAGQIYIAARRQSANPVENNHYRLDLTTAGALAMRRSVHGTTVEITTLGTSATSVQAGDAVAFRVVGGQLTAKINGATVITATDSTWTQGGYAGLHSSTSAPGAALGSMKLTAL